MPVVQKRPHGPLVRSNGSLFHYFHLTNKQIRTFVEGHHFGPLWSRRKVVRFGMDAPVVGSPVNIPYVDMESEFNRTTTSLKVHESRVYVGQDVFLVSGYWDPKADINRSVFAVTKVIWRGEISVVRAGRYIPYTKRMRDGRKADVAVRRYVSTFVISFVLTVDVWQLRTVLQASKIPQEVRPQDDPRALSSPVPSPPTPNFLSRMRTCSTLMYCIPCCYYLCKFPIILVSVSPVNHRASRFFQEDSDHSPSYRVDCQDCRSADDRSRKR
jgi:hypothetical protein